MHDSLTIALLQAREAAMSYFRPIVKRHNLTEQQWRIVRVLAEHPSMEAYQQIEAEFTPEKMKQLTALLEEFIELGNRHNAAREEE